MDPYVDLHERIDRLCERARTEPDQRLVAEMNDVLSEGYARALLDERHVVALEERLVELLLAPERSPALRSMAEERHAASRRITCLRERLADMQAQFVLLGGGC